MCEGISWAIADTISTRVPVRLASVADLAAIVALHELARPWGGARVSNTHADFDEHAAAALPPGPVDWRLAVPAQASGLGASAGAWPRARCLPAGDGPAADRFYAFDWNTLDRAADHAAALDALIDRVRAAHQVDRVDLMGHSAGGGLGVGYLDDPARAVKVRRYVHVGSVQLDAPIALNAPK